MAAQVEDRFFLAHKRIHAQVAQGLRQFPEVQAAYYRTSGDTLEFFVVAEFTRDRETAFYEAEADWLRDAPLGILSVLLINMNNFEHPDSFTPPPQSSPVSLPL